MNADFKYILDAFLPEIMLVILGLLVLAADLLLPKGNCRKALTLIAAFGALLAGGIAVGQWMLTATNPTPAFVSYYGGKVVQGALPVAEASTDAQVRDAVATLNKVTAANVVQATASSEAHENITSAQTRQAFFGYWEAQRRAPELPTLSTGIGRPDVAVWWFFANDQFAATFKIIIALAVFLVLLLSVRFPVAQYRGEFAGLLLFAAAGLMVMVNSLDLVVLFLGLETASLCLYALAAWHKNDARSAEAGTKYVLLGSLASAFFIYGASLLFVRIGSTHLLAISRSQLGDPMIVIGLLMLLTAFAFKVAAAPFHLWAPDVYQGAPTSVAAFLSTASKAAGFAVLLRVLTMGFLHVSPLWWQLIGVMAALSMLIGNLIAVHQNNMKRLLAYSGIAQAGYILIAVMALGLAYSPLRQSTDPHLALTAAIFYLFLYAVGNIGAFAIIGIVSRETGHDEMSAFAGLRWRAPLLAFAMALLLLSLGGIPLLAGFVGKWFIFLAAVSEGQYLLVLLGAALSVVSIYYYLLVIKQMYMIPAPDGAAPIRVGGFAALGLLLIVGLTVVIGVWPGPFLEQARATAMSLLP